MLLHRDELRLQQIDDLDIRDEHFLWLMKEYPPLTKLKHGDIVYLQVMPPRIAMCPFFQRHGIPRFWKVQFVVSRYQFELHHVMHQFEFDGDQAVTFLDHAGFDYDDAQTPFVYAHAFPHGDNPNSARWFAETALKRLCLRTAEADWDEVLDEFETPFYGYEQTGSGFILDVAPERYAKGVRIGAPLSHEEPTFHTAASLGLEEAMLRKEPYRGSWDDLDPEHDVFVSAWDER